MIYSFPASVIIIAYSPVPHAVPVLHYIVASYHRTIPLVLLVCFSPLYHFTRANFSRLSVINPVLMPWSTLIYFITFCRSVAPSIIASPAFRFVVVLTLLPSSIPPHSITSSR
jgi:hypothetical protein